MNALRGAWRSSTVLETSVFALERRYLAIENKNPGIHAGVFAFRQIARPGVPKESGSRDQSAPAGLETGARGLARARTIL
jgi:hypothetical protein